MDSPSHQTREQGPEDDGEDAWRLAIAASPRLNRLTMDPKARLRLVQRLVEERGRLLRRRAVLHRLLPMALAAGLLLAVIPPLIPRSSGPGPGRPALPILPSARQEAVPRPAANVCKAVRHGVDAKGPWERVTLLVHRPDQPTYALKISLVRHGRAAPPSTPTPPPTRNTL